MIWYVGILGILFVAMHLLSPKIIVADAARSKPAEATFGANLRPVRLFASPYMRHVNKGHIEMKNRVLVRVRGDSCKAYGLNDRATVIADVLDSSGRSNLKRDDLVVINSALPDGRSPFRLRKIEKIENGVAYFYDDSGGHLKAKPIEGVYGKIVYA